MILFSAGTYSYSFPLYKSREFVLIFNKLFNNNYVRLSRSVFLIVFNTMLLSAILPFFYAMMVFYSNIDPVTAHVEQNVKHLSMFYQMFMIIFKAVDLRNFSYICRITCFLAFEIMLASYMATMVLINGINTPHSNHKSAPEPFHKLIQSILK